jgi:hypothetical protein
MACIMNGDAYPRLMARRSGGLDSAQVEQLREKLSNGGRPRVKLSGPQFPADTLGTVVRIGDPAVDGDDYVTVRARVGGIVDELAFSPSELSGTGKTSAKPSPPAVKRRPGRPRKTIADAPTAAPPLPTPAAVESAPTSKTTPAVEAPSALKPAERPSSRGRRTGSVPTVKITVVSSGASWTVSVDRGARTLVKNAMVTPGAVTAIAGLIGDAGVEDAVAAVNHTARTEAEARAEQLRTELAEVQALLNSHLAP